MGKALGVMGGKGGGGVAHRLWVVFVWVVFCLYLSEGSLLVISYYYERYEENWERVCVCVWVCLWERKCATFSTVKCSYILT